MIIFDLNVNPLTADEEAFVFAGLDAHSAALGAPDYNKKPFGLHARDGEQTVGMLSGNTVWNWLYIELLWVEEKYRHQNIGTELMQRAEACARKENLTGIWLSTQNWQAPEFYQKLGYEIFAEFKDFPPGYQKYLLRKYL